MTDGPDNLILAYLRRLDEKVDRLIADVQDLKGRVTGLERQVGELHVTLASQSARIDRIEARLDRIERRLDLVGTS